MKKNRSKLQSAKMTLTAVLVIFLMIRPAYAASPEITISSLATTLATIVAVVGKLVTAAGIFELGTAIYGHDTSQIPPAFRTLAAGLLMVFIDLFLAGVFQVATQTQIIT